MEIHKKFRQELTEFMQRTGMASSAIGRGALKDPWFVERFLQGKRSPTIKTVEKVSRWMQKQEKEESHANL